MLATAYNTEQRSGNLEITWGQNSKPCKQEVINQWETVNQKKNLLTDLLKMSCVQKKQDILGKRKS